MRLATETQAAMIQLEAKRWLDKQEPNSIFSGNIPGMALLLAEYIANGRGLTIYGPLKNKREKSA
jgi:hypothetical protein